MSEAAGFVVFGASGHGKVVAEIGLALGEVLHAFIDDAPQRRGTNVFSVPVLAWDEFRSSRFSGAPIALGVGENVARARVTERIRSTRLCIHSLVHPRAWVSPTARLGVGTVAMAGAMVNADAVIGNGCILNTGSIVEHDARLGDFVLVGPGVAMGGNVSIGEFSVIGVGARILPGIRVGLRTRVGAGAVVVSDLSDDITVVGIPARPLAKGSSHRRMP